MLVEEQQIKLNEELARHTSYRVGGVARTYFTPNSEQELINFLSTNKSENKLFWLGLGSNILIRDGGFNGTVIHTRFIKDEISILEETADGKLLRISAGTTCAKIAKFCAKNNLVEAEFFAGIPGTMGGALAMNAGAWGGETFNHLVTAIMINETGRVFNKNRQDFIFDYRHVELAKNEWFLAGVLFFKNGDSTQATAKIKELLKVRNKTQPVGVYSCGSVFKNPNGNYAAELIESSKLKGIELGGAVVSNKHANFIVNNGTATAKDIEDLIMLVQHEVLGKTGIKLEPEVRIIGEDQSL